MATKPTAKKPAATSAQRSLADIDTRNLSPEQIAALAEQTAGAGRKKRKTSPRSNQNWEVTELAGLPQAERDAALDAVAQKLTATRHKVSTKTGKVPKNAGKHPETVKSDEKKGGPDENGLYTDKQRAFVDEYLIDFNGTQAAIRAGYSSKTANEQAAGLLAKLSIQKLLAERKAARVQRTEITQDRVLQELARLAFLDIRKAFNEDGSLKPIQDLDDETAAAIAGIDVVEMAGAAGIGGDGIEHIPLQTKKIKLAEKKGALELLMRHMGMLNDKLKLQGDPEQPLQVQTKVVLVPPKQTAQVETKPLDKAED